MEENVNTPNIEQTDFNDFILEAKKTYNTEIGIETSNLYDAFNNENYEIYISYKNWNNELEVAVKSPEELKDISWPTNDMVSLLPKHKTLKGKI